MDYNQDRISNIWIQKRNGQILEENNMFTNYAFKPFIYTEL